MAPPTAHATKAAWQIYEVPKSAGQRIGIHGAGGIGKTTLAMGAPSPIILDLDKGAREVLDRNGKRCREVRIETYQDVRDALHADIWSDCQTIVIDSATALQELIVPHVLDTVRHEKGQAVTCIEGYGFGKGYTHVYDAWLLLLADLDAHVAQGRHVVIVCHTVTAQCPNPEGEDYLRYEPDLQQPPKTGRVRDRIKAWLDHLFLIHYDIAIDKTGKAKGAGSRAIYCQEMPTFWAKSRRLVDPIPFPKGSTELWDKLFEERSDA